MITTEFAERFATEWVEAWNRRDLDRVLSHYDEGIVTSSPMIVQVVGEPSGTLTGKKAVGAYWAKALTLLPDLHFKLLATLVGVNSITLYYKGAQGRPAAEVLHFGPGGKVVNSFAHYG